MDEPKLADPDVTSGNDMQATAQSLAAAAEQEFRYAEIFVVAIVVTSVEVLIGCSMLAGLAMSRRLTRTLSRSARSPAAETSRIMATAFQPFSAKSLAVAWPNPVDEPGISAVFLFMSLRLQFGIGGETLFDCAVLQIHPSGWPDTKSESVQHDLPDRALSLDDLMRISQIFECHAAQVLPDRRL